MFKFIAIELGLVSQITLGRGNPRIEGAANGRPRSPGQ